MLGLTSPPRLLHVPLHGPSQRTSPWDLRTATGKQNKFDRPLSNFVEDDSVVPRVPLQSQPQRNFPIQTPLT